MVLHALNVLFSCCTFRNRSSQFYELLLNLHLDALDDRFSIFNCTDVFSSHRTPVLVHFPYVRTLL